MANSALLKKILVVSIVLFGVGQLLVFRYGAKHDVGQVPGFQKPDKRAQSMPSESRESKEMQLSALERGAFPASGAGKGLQQNASRNGVRNLSNVGFNLQPQNKDEGLPDREAGSRQFDQNNSFGQPLQNETRDGATSSPKFRFDGTRKSSFVSPKYHTHYNVNCSAVVYGDRKVVAATNHLMGKPNKKLPIPSDDTVGTWTKECNVFRAERRYPSEPRSEEEANYPVAFIIVTHKESAQVERLLRAIYQPQNVYCIHPDSKSPPAYQAAIRSIVACFDNVFIPSKIEDIQYAGFTRLQADINCMADLLQHPAKWRYIVNLCGQDFPLKTNLEIVRQLKAYKDKNDINGILPPPYIKGRTSSHFKSINGKMTATRLHKSPPPYNLTVYFGNAYYAASRAFAEYVIHDTVAVALLEWSMDTFSPDEHYWVTLNRAPGVPGGYPHPTWDANVRFMKWGDIPKHPPCQGRYVRALCVFGVGYLNYLTKMTHLFANKFYYSFDPVILQCLEELLDFRTAHPETIEDFVLKFPVRDLEWQLT